MIRSSRRQAQTTTGVLALAALLCTAGTGARAHYGPAEPPDFGFPECITVVDSRTTQVVMLEYMLGYDAVGPEPGHIQLAGAKTHSFFAFDGQVLQVQPEFALLQFDPATFAALRLATWINSDDLNRATAAAVGDMTINMTDFMPAMLAGDNLNERSDLAGHWFPMVGADTRV